jgi:hypothetical protein
LTKLIQYFIPMTLLLASVSASAQATRPILVSVPFPFVTAGKNWPAGDYKVEVRRDFGILTLGSPGVASATMLTTPEAIRNPGSMSPGSMSTASLVPWIVAPLILESWTAAPDQPRGRPARDQEDDPSRYGRE